MVRNKDRLLGVLALALGTAVPSLAYAEAQGWRATLNLYLRAGASSRAEIVTEIPQGTGGLIELEACRWRWCHVTWQGKTGWVYRRLLVPDGGESAGDPARAGTALTVRSDTTLREFPGEEMPAVGEAAAGSRGVATGRCIEPWCALTLDGRQGWLPRNLLVADAPTPPAEPAATTETATDPLPAARTVPGAYRIAGLPQGVALPVHGGIGETTATVGALDSALPVEVDGPCERDWCRIRQRQTAGWVLRRHLVQSGLPARRYVVSGVPLWETLAMRAHPAADAPIVIAIPPYGSGLVSVGQCDETWCHVSYRDAIGWVQSGNLAAVP